MANSWRRERWDSLRLLTPNWQSRLPGHRYDGPDPDGYMTMREVIEFISRFATRVARAGSHRYDRHVGDAHRRRVSRRDDQRRYPLPVRRARERRVQPAERPGGAAHRCRRPSNRSPRSTTATPSQLPDGGVLVVGASATGVQLAAEIRRSGRPVTLSVGEHVRLPRTYRGRDVLWWMDRSGVWDQRYDDIDDLTRARRLPSPQLVGTPDRATLDLNALTRDGGRAGGPVLRGARRPGALLRRAAEHVRARGSEDGPPAGHLRRVGARRSRDAADDDFGEPERFEPTRAPESSRLQIDLRSGEIRTIVWATGFRPDYSWLHVPVLDEKGHLRHDGGVVDSPGMYVLGLPVLRRRKSSFIHGAEDDAREVVDHLAGYLGRTKESRLNESSPAGTPARVDALSGAVLDCGVDAAATAAAPCRRGERECRVLHG